MFRNSFPPPALAELLKLKVGFRTSLPPPLLDHLAQNFCRGATTSRGARFGEIAPVPAGHPPVGRRRPQMLVLAFNRALTYATQCAWTTSSGRIAYS